MPALTLGLQAAVALSFVAFGLLSLAVPRRAPGAPPAHRTAWLLCGAAFTVHGLVFLGHTSFGALAVLGGPGSPVYSTYLTWTPPLNHSRTFLLLGLTVMIGVLAMARTRPERRVRAAAAAVMGAGFVGGLAIGYVEPEFSTLTHYSAVATWDVVELLALLAALFAALLTSRVDRYLWLALAIYAFSLALNVMWIAALSRHDVEGEWSPRPWMIHAYRLVLTLGMVAVAARRLHLARRNVPVAALMESSTHRPGLAG